MIKSPKALRLTLLILTLIPRNPKRSQTHRLVRVLNQSRLRLLAAHSLQYILRHILSQRLLEYRSESLRLADQMVAITPEGLIQDVYGGGGLFPPHELRGRKGGLCGVGALGEGFVGGLDHGRPQL